MDDILFWQTRITLTQYPEPFKPEFIPEANCNIYENWENKKLLDL